MPNSGKDRPGPLDSIAEKIDDVQKQAAGSSLDRHRQISHLESRLADYQIASDLRMLRFEARLEAIDAEQKKNTELTQVNTNMTADMHEIIVMARSFFAGAARFARAMGAVIRWAIKAVRVGGIVAAGLSAMWLLVWTLLHGGKPPTP